MNKSLKSILNRTSTFNSWRKQFYVPKYLTFLILLFLSTNAFAQTPPCSTPQVWINEIHYDNASTDVGEFVEIAGTEGFDLSTCQLYFYNGSSGNTYGGNGGFRQLTGTIDDEGSGFGAVSFDITSLNISSIQNGAPDGLALVCNGELIQFISYEGTFVAAGNSSYPAFGMTSVDIGVSETSSSSVGFSLQLQGMGNSYSDFIWAAPSAESPGSLNAGQIIDCTTPPTNCNQAPFVFINEIHYDNASTDVGEFVEIAGTAGFDLSTCQIYRYNGSNGNTYGGSGGFINLTGTIDDEGNGYGAVSFDIGAIQNGAPDGLALVCNGELIQFISYEGTFLAAGNTGYPAFGMTSEDIGVSETSTTPVGFSLQLQGTGSTYADFIWAEPSAESPGTLNAGQILECPPTASCNEGPLVFINEIHYDNASTDVGEFVEIAGTAGFDLSTCQIYRYNGSNGNTYGGNGGFINLSGTIDDESNGYGAVAFNIGAIQNGAPDGLALVCNGELIQFISYEGSFVAAGNTGYPAFGITSEDIGVSETSSTAIGLSIQLQGMGNTYAEFNWTAPSAESPGSLNAGQIIECPACEPSLVCPNPATFDCGDDISAWLNSVIFDACETGATVSNNYSAANFNKCMTTTENITFSLTDPSGAILESCMVALTLNAAPAPTLANISFPSSMTCEMAAAFTPPSLSYSNNLLGSCLISGNIMPTNIQNSWTACGGEITFEYSGTDECGNQLNGGSYTIAVDPAPAPVLTAPSIPFSISCENAINFTAADASFTNGLNGTCNISGTVPAAVITNFNACGGTITITYAGEDICGNDLSIPAIVVQVLPANIPAITLPTLPTNLTCGDATTYAPPMASFTNGLPGVCLVSGNVSAQTNHFYDACGGTLEVIYSGEDACGRNLVAMVAVINVDPAPIPTIDIPNFPTSLSCSDAENFQAPYTPYDNGLTGVCNISGFIQPTLIYDVNACDGGMMFIIYNGTDDCGNVLSANPIVVQVDPASIPTLKEPDFVPSNIDCWVAAYGYDPGNAIFTNGETGFCENSGEIEPVISEFWNECDGGFIIYDYGGVDNCGNELTPIVIKVAVLPDTWAPDGACTPYSETMSIEDVPGPDELDYYFDQVAVGYYELCSEVLVTVIDDTGVPQCSDEGFFERVYTVEISDACGNIAGTCSITFSGSCNATYCTMTQKFYGNPDDEINGQSSGDIISTLIQNGSNPIVIGDGSDCGFIINETQCIQALMNSYGQSISLPSGFNTNCFDTNNSLINQMVTTILNIRYNESLNPAGSLDFGSFPLSAACMNVPGFMLAELPTNPTVNDLLNYANNFIACQCSNTCDNYQPIMAELTNLFWGLNSRFNNCHVAQPCDDAQDIDFTEFGNDTASKITSIDLYPNPTNDIINIQVKNFIGLPATLEIFDTRGSRLGAKTYQSIDQSTLEFDVHDFEVGLYWLSIKVEGHELITQKFIVVK